MTTEPTTKTARTPPHLADPHGARGMWLRRSLSGTEALPVRRKIWPQWGGAGFIAGRGAATPGRFRRIAALLLILLLSAGSVGVWAASVRSEAIDEIAARVEPLSADATELYRSLADADAMAAGGLLAAGTDPAPFRERYEANIAQAMASLLRASTQADDPVTSDRVSDLGELVPVYAGLVEQARAHSQLGSPASAAYLATASDLMRSTILPEAEALQRSQADRLDAEYQRAGSLPVAGAVLVGAALLGLVWAQVVVARRTRRVFNLGLVASTAVVLCALVWWTVAGTVSGDYLRSSQAHSQTVTDALAPAQIAALQARGSETLALAAGLNSEKDFDARMTLLARDNGAGGALGAALRFAPDPAGRGLVDAAISETRAYMVAHDQVRRLADAGSPDAAVEFALAAEPASAAATFARLDAALAEAVAYERVGFAEAIDRAHGWRAGLVIGTGLLALAAAGAALFGIAQRLREYRPA